MLLGILLAFGLVASPVGAAPCDPQLTPDFDITREDVGRAGDAFNRHAVMAFEFANQHGRGLYKKVFRSAGPLNVIIAMGGAEHLYSYLRARAHYAGRVDVRFYPLYLTQKMIRPWNARESQLPYPATETRHEFGEEEIRSYTGQSDRVLEYVAQSGALDEGREIVVVDTGFNGTVVEVVASAARRFGTGQTVRGVLLAHNPPAMVKNTVEIDAVGDAGADDLFKPAWWAKFIEDGPPETHWSTACEVPDEVRDWPTWERGGLQRSCESPTRLIRVRGNWGPVTEPFTRPEVIRKWKDAVIGMTFAARAHARKNSDVTNETLAREIQLMGER